MPKQDKQIHQERESLLPSLVTEIKLDQIKPRSFDDTRSLNPIHVLNLALSIEAVGLIEPIVVDQEFHLLAGAHRLNALKVLSLEDREATCHELRKLIKKSQESHFDELVTFLPKAVSIDFQKIPVRVFQFLAKDDVAYALKIESIENTQRKNYTSKEVFNLYKRLLETGYEDVKGRPREDQRPVLPILALIIGQSIRSVQRKLKEEKEGVIKKRGRSTQIDMITSLISRLNSKIESSTPKTKEKLKSDEEFLKQIKKIREWIENY